MEQFNAIIRKHKFVIIIFVVSITLLLSSAICIGLSNFNLTLPTVGTVKTIGVEACWDQNLENNVETIDWNTIWPGLTKNVTLYIRSASNVKTFLNLNTSNVYPAIFSEYLTLSWNYDGTPLDPNEIIQVTLFLSASTDGSLTRYLVTNKVKDFSIDINIAAYEYGYESRIS